MYTVRLGCSAIVGLAVVCLHNDGHNAVAFLDLNLDSERVSGLSSPAVHYTTMFDPLSSTSSIFAGGDDPQTPPWPTTPHSPGASIPNMRRASPVPPTPEKGPTPGLYGKEPQIYGQPEVGLISPREAVGPNGVQYEKAEPYLRVRINGIDRNRRDILVKLDAQVHITAVICSFDDDY